MSEERVSVGSFESFVLANPDDETTLVAQVADKVVGFGRIVFITGEITSLYVSPQVAGGGIGSKLMTAVEERAHDRGLNSIWLTAALNATKFYRRCGFIGEHEIECELPGKLSMIVVKMCKVLANS